jgi:hypothetical protein
MAVPPAPTPQSRRSSRFSMRSKQIGQLLIENGDIQAEQIAKALKIQEQQGGLIGQILQRMGACSADSVAAGLLKQVQVTDIQCDDVTASPEVLALVPREQCEAEKLCPFELLGKLLCVVMGNPLNRRAINAIEDATHLKVKPFKAPWPKIHELLDRSTEAVSAAAPAGGAEGEGEAPAIESLGEEASAPAIEEVPAEAPVEEVPAEAPAPEPVPEPEPDIQGLDNLDEANAEVIETDARGLTRRKRPPRADDGPYKIPKRNAKVNVNLDAFDASAAAEVVESGEAEGDAEEPLEEISAAAAAAQATKAPTSDVPKFTQAPVAFFYEGGTVPPKKDQPTEEYLGLVGTLPVAETLAQSIGEYRSLQEEEKKAKAAEEAKKIEAVAVAAVPQEKVKKELAPEYAAAPAEPVTAVALSDAEFQQLSSGLELDPLGVWTWQYAAPGPVPVEEYQTENA